MRRKKYTPVAKLVRASWIIVAFDTAGEVSFAGISTLTNPVFRLVLHVNRAYFRLRQPYRFW
jgi:hypothetical protein